MRSTGIHSQSTCRLLRAIEAELRKHKRCCLVGFCFSAMFQTNFAIQMWWFCLVALCRLSGPKVVQNGKIPSRLRTSGIQTLRPQLPGGLTVWSTKTPRPEQFYWTVGDFLANCQSVPVWGMAPKCMSSCIC